MAVLKAMADPQVKAAGAVNFQRLIQIIKGLLAFLGPVAVPLIEAWVATLPLTPAEIAIIDKLIESILNPAPTPVTP